MPCHVGWGTDLEIAGNGLINMCEADIGATMTFLGMNAAMEQLFFGRDAPTWGNKEWSELADYLVHGLHPTEAQWDGLEYRPRMWDTEDQAKARASKGEREKIAELRRRMKSPSDFTRHCLDQLAFLASDVISTSSVESWETAANGTNLDLADYDFENIPGGGLQESG